MKGEDLLGDAEASPSRGISHKALLCILASWPSLYVFFTTHCKQNSGEALLEGKVEVRLMQKIEPGSW